MISVVVPTYNRPAHLQRLLLSLNQQCGLDCSFEVIVVDDGSEKQLTDLPSTSFSVRTLRNPKNVGRSVSRNEGARAAQYDLIVFVDDDMILSSAFLRSHWLAHQANSGIVGIGNIITAGKSLNTPYARYYDRTGVHRLSELKPAPYKYFVTGNCSMERALLIRAGMFDEAFSVHYGGEDLDLGLRLARVGASFRFVRDAISYHHDLSDLIGIREKMREFGMRGLPLLVGKHPQLRRELGLQLAERWWSGLVLSAVPLQIAERIVILGVPDVINYWLIRYLVVGSYLRAYRAVRTNSVGEKRSWVMALVRSLRLK